MSKKTLRKSLEASLSKMLVETLNQRDPSATGKISKTIGEASRMIAKKFYKTSRVPKPPVAKKAPAKATPKKAAPKKKSVVKTKAKGKK
jgi:hypothetical protein